MAIWRKVVVSGSAAELTALKVDNLTSGQVVIGGGSAGNLSTTAINGSGNIVGTVASGLSHSGSFSGSFQGSFSGTATLPNLTQSTGITAFTYNGSSATTVAVSGASTLNTNSITRWTGTAFGTSSLTDNGTVISGVSSIQLTGASSRLSGSFSGSFFGDGSGLSGIAASFPTTPKTDLATSDQFFISDGASKFITYGNLLVDLAGTNLVTESGDSLTLAPNISGLTSINATNFTGSFFSGSHIGNAAGLTAVTASALNNTAITNNSDNRILTATGGTTINGETNLTFDGSTLTVTGNQVVSNNLTVNGDLTVNGTTTFINTTNTYIEDQFVLIASGSTTLTDAGFVAQYNAAGSGSAFYLESTSAGTYGRWAVAFDVIGTATAVTPNEYVVTARINEAANPVAAPTWGSTGNGSGNMWVTNAGDIWIYA